MGTNGNDFPMLTEIRIRAAKPGKYSDGRGDGLMLVVKPTGAKFFVQRIKTNGKYRDIGHGSWPNVTLAEARRRAEATKQLAASGVEPVQARKAAKAADPTGHTFLEAAEGYLTAHAPAWKGEKTAKLFRTRLEQHADHLLSMDPAAVSVADVTMVLQPIWTTKPVLAQKLRSHIEHVLEWATAAGWRPHGVNAAAWKGVLRPLLAKPAAVTRNRHNPALDWKRAPAFLSELRGEPPLTARCLELAILTAVRSGEARGVRWDEINFDESLWTIPAERTKSGREHVVPLNLPALALLKALHHKRAAGPVFLNPKGETYSDNALLALIRRMDRRSIARGEAGWKDSRGELITPHGFRSTFRDWCGDNGKPRDVAEAALAHADGSSTERAYARSTLLARRKGLMAEWASHCSPS